MERFRPGEVRGFLERRLASPSRLLVTWDSPLTFDPESSFSDRPIDKATRGWVSRMVKKGRKGHQRENRCMAAADRLAYLCQDG